MPKPVILIGFGENARVIEAALKHERTIKGYLDDHKRDPRVLGRIDEIDTYRTECDFFLSIGNNAIRRAVFERLKSSGITFINAIHEQAYLEPGVQLGENIFVGARTVINVGSTIGNNTFINTGCIIEHDNTIADHAHLAPGVITGGGVTIGQETFVGLGARINDHVTVGSAAIIGSGAVVVNTIPDRVTAVGVPAKIIKHHTV